MIEEETAHVAAHVSILQTKADVDEALVQSPQIDPVWHGPVMRRYDTEFDIGTCKRSYGELEFVAEWHLVENHIRIVVLGVEVELEHAHVVTELLDIFLLNHGKDAGVDRRPLRTNQIEEKLIQALYIDHKKNGTHGLWYALGPVTSEKVA